MEGELISSSWLPSTRSMLYGRFRIFDCVGKGAFGTVYQAVDTELDNRTVALKCVHSHLLFDDKIIQRLIREVLLTRRLRHPGIVSVYELLSGTPGPAVVMEFVDGESLDALIQSGECHRMSISEKIDLLYQIASALAHAHENGVVHRDIKPENILLSLQGEVKIADFGLARCFDDGQKLTKTGASLGTPFYMSPEQFQGMNAGPSGDVYSLGILAYELISGQKPFVDEVYFSLALKHLLEPLPPIALPSEKLPEWLHPFLEKCTDKNIANRFPSMQKVADILDEARIPCNSTKWSEAIFRVKCKGKRKQRLSRLGRTVTLCKTLLLRIVIAHFVIWGLAQINRDICSRIEAEFLVAERIIGSTAVFPIKYALGISDLHVDNPQDLFNAIQRAERTSCQDQGLKALVRAGAELNIHDADGNTPLTLLTGLDCGVTRLMLENGADINAQGKDGASFFLQLIATGSDTALLDRLLPLADLSIKDNNGWNALHIAVSQGNIQAIKILLADRRSKPLLFDKEKKFGVTPLMFVVAQPYPFQEREVRMLLEAGSDPSAVSKDGINALGYASASGFTAAAFDILEKSDRSVVSRADNNGITPLMYLLDRMTLSRVSWNSEERRLAAAIVAKLDTD